MQRSRRITIWTTAVVLGLGIGAVEMTSRGDPPPTDGGHAGPSEVPASALLDDAAAVRLKLDLSDRELRVLRGDDVVETYQVAVGRPKYPTPTGTFSIRRIVWNPRWVPPDSEWAKDRKPTPPGDPDNPMGRVKIFFREPTYYLHGTHDTDSLGRAESHGCVRLRNGDAISLAQLLMRNGGAERSDGWMQKVLDKVRSTREVQLSRPVTLTIVR